jgi:hypothetical protein
VAVRIVVGWKRTVSSASPPTLLRIEKSDATENGKDGFSVENLVEKIAAIRERRQRNEDMLARNSIGPERAGSRSPTPTAERWRRIRALRWVTTCQIAVDAKHKLIVEQQVANQVVDMDLLAQTVEPAHQS